MKPSVISSIVGIVMVSASLYGFYIVTRATLYVSSNNNYAPSIQHSIQPLLATTVFASSSTPQVKNPQVKNQKDYPVTLYIPSLKINAKIQQVGLNSKGAIGAPDNFTDVVWYKYGPAPGQPGSAIIDGHVDNGLGLAGVFKHLSSIATGSEMAVTTSLGTTLVFKVTAINVYGYQQVPMATILNSSTPTLDLITCDGTWVGNQRTYNERLVVTAKLI